MTATFNSSDRRRITAATLFTVFTAALMLVQSFGPAAGASLPPLGGTEPSIGPVGPVGPIIPTEPCPATGCDDGGDGGAELEPIDPGPEVGPLDPGPLDPCDAPIKPRECAPDGGAGGPGMGRPGEGRRPVPSDPSDPSDPELPGDPSIDPPIMATPTFTG